MRLLLGLPLLALSGCAGYAADYWRPRIELITPELPRYGLDERQARCTAERLAATLSVWQLRQLAMTANAHSRAASVAPTPRHLLAVARVVRDPAVAPAVEQAATACGLEGAQPSAPPPASVPASAPPAPARPEVPLWINLGSAPTGQGIAVDASSLGEEAGLRSAWFRLINPGAAQPGGSSYLLRIDCRARTINQMALRRHGPGGAIVEQRDFGPGGEGAAPVERGTVMEIAYLSLCT